MYQKQNIQAGLYYLNLIVLRLAVSLFFWKIDGNSNKLLLKIIYAAGMWRRQ
jgi:hypothetical protein